MYDILKEIKKLHEQANELYSNERKEEALEIVKQLFLDEQTDWLIEQAEKIEKYEEALEFYGFDCNSIGEDGTVAKKALGYGC